MSSFTNTGFVQVRIVVGLLVGFWGLVQLVVEIGHHLVFAGRDLDIVIVLQQFAVCRNP